MLKSWPLSAIAAFSLEGVVLGQFGGVNPFGQGGIIVPGQRGGSSVPTQPITLPHIGDDKIRIARNTYLLIEFFSRPFHRGD